MQRQLETARKSTLFQETRSTDRQLPEEGMSARWIMPDLRDWQQSRWSLQADFIIDQGSTSVLSAVTL